MFEILNALILLINFTLSSAIIGPAALSYANPGVLERVAVNRAAGITKYDVPENWEDYPVLIAIDNCSYVGQEALLITTVGKYKALIVDCTAGHHKKLDQLKLLADTNMKQITHRTGIIVIGDINNEFY